MADEPTYRSDALELRRSPIHGYGLFALRPFVPGERIKQIDDSATASPELIEQVFRGATTFRLDDYPDRMVALPFPDGFFNHSCDPNAYARWDSDGRFVVARRAISIDEEITEDYRINGWGHAIWWCKCGSACCRRAVHCDFFCLPPDLQREYEPLLAPWFVEMNSFRL